ncbi:GNAT family N-acetyltransferase [Pelagibaculum spongiae]|uniref:N-acetyltransferase domain-containing protein n=1 Tax=Pelagibaculum spongiae TaxID=2080658 RepID=A0A2V1GW80_9GAMM|nr:GNAT family N-acetyltransferase [Pelagibaculum spongiae]PVZ64973.1 hypothetical protein DC094_19110 [Pelagibaculum spongiae]
MLNNQKIDDSWKQKLQLSNAPAKDSLISNCDYYQHPDIDIAAFIYLSDSLSIINPAASVATELTPSFLKNPQQFMAQISSLGYESYTEDHDYYLFDEVQPFTNQHWPIVELNSERDNKEINQFFESCNEEDVFRSDIDDSMDYYYAVKIKQKIVGLLASYCATEPFESLSILVHHQHRQQHIAQALLNHLTVQAKQRNRHIRYRTAVDNISSIRLCESLGFTAHSKIITISKSENTVYGNGFSRAQASKPPAKE